MTDDSLLGEERRLQGEIDVLRTKFPETQDLYREVCVLLFFRHGITPTANKLYQLVRKGSMSAPGEALASFWTTLREKSRVRIEHPDLPEELRDAAGDVISALWQRARGLADETLAALRDEVKASTDRLSAELEAAQSRVTDAEQSLVGVTESLALNKGRVQQLEQDLAREQGVREALDKQLEQAAEQRRELQRALEDARLGFQKQLAEQRSAVTSAEDRHQNDLRRIMLDLDRERSLAGKLQKELDQGKRHAAEEIERHRERIVNLEGEMARLRQKLSGAEAALAESRIAGDRLQAHLDKALAKPQRRVSTKKPLTPPGP